MPRTPISKVSTFPVSKPTFYSCHDFFDEESCCWSGVELQKTRTRHDRAENIDFPGDKSLVLKSQILSSRYLCSQMTSDLQNSNWLSSLHALSKCCFMVLEILTGFTVVWRYCREIQILNRLARDKKRHNSARKYDRLPSPISKSAAPMCLIHHFKIKFNFSAQTKMWR